MSGARQDLQPITDTACCRKPSLQFGPTRVPRGRGLAHNLRAYRIMYGRWRPVLGFFCLFVDPDKAVRYEIL